MPSSAATVLEIPGDFAPLVRKARRKPVALSQNGGKTVAAYLVSAKTYKEMAELAEDAYWAKRADEAMKEPPIGEVASRKLMADMRRAVNAHRQKKSSRRKSAF